MTDVLIYGDTVRHPELRHEVPLALGDPFLYLEKDGRSHIVITDFEWPRLQEAGVDAELISPTARDLFRRADQSNGRLTVNGEPLTSERVKVAIQRAFMDHGCTAEEFIVSHGAQSAIGHDMGSGEIGPGEPIVIDLWPKDADTACFADMTRTFCIGDVPRELRDYHRLCKESLDLSLAAVKA